MDMYAFAELSPEGKNLLVDCAVNATLDWMTQGMFPENWQSVKTDLLEVLNQRQSEYGARANIFASDWDAVVARGGVPGVSDALSDNPANKVSWLYRVLKNDVLDGYAPGSVDATPKVRSTADIWGIGLEDAYSLECFLAVQTAAMRGLAEGKMPQAIRETRKPLRRVKPDQKLERSETLLHGAVKNAGAQSLIERLLDMGEHVNASDEKGVRPLHLAAGLDVDPEVVELLLDRGADIHALADDGSTPLHWAARSDQGATAVKLLLERGADIHATGGGDGTPLHVAAAFNREISVAELLLE